MSAVRDAEVGDIYVDEHDQLWQVTSTCSEPTVSMRRIERPELIHQSGGVNGLMWSGFTRIWRPKRPAWEDSVESKLDDMNFMSQVVRGRSK